MSQIEEPTDLTVTDDTDVEGHGLREVAAGITVTAAVLGGAAAANAAVVDNPSVGGGVQAAAAAFDGTLRGTNLQTGHALAKQGKTVTDPAVATGYAADSAIVSVKGSAASAVAAALAATETARDVVDATRDTADEAAARTLEDAEDVVASSSSDLAELLSFAQTNLAGAAGTAGEIAGALGSDVNTAITAANTLVEAASIALSTTVSYFSGVVGQKVSESVTTVELAKADAEALIAAAVVDVTNTADNTRHFALATGDEVRRAGMAAIEASIATANQKLAETQVVAVEAVNGAKVALQNLVVVADDAAKTAITGITGMARAAGTDAQALAGSTIGTALGVPGSTMNTVISNLQDTKDKWDDVAGDLPQPDLAGVVDAGADAAEDAVGDIEPDKVIAPAIS